MLAFDEVDDEAAGVRPRSDPRRLYGRWYYESSCGLPYHDNDHWQAFFGHVAENIVSELKPVSVLDAGCAKGFLVSALRERGVDASGFDLSELAIAATPDAAKPHVQVGSLTDPIEGEYDLVTCIEVVEHLDPADACLAIANLCAASDRVLFSSTPGDLHEATHVNVRPTERWSQLFASQGLFRDFRYDAAYLTPWAALYRRETRSVSDVVFEYERAWLQLRAETIEQRRALLEAHCRFDEVESSGGIADRLEADNQLLRKEVLRLRDALIGKEAELGTVCGRAAEIDSQHALLQVDAHAAGQALVQTRAHAEAQVCAARASVEAALADRDDAFRQLHRVVHSRSWRVIWAAGWPVRAIQARRAR